MDLSSQRFYVHESEALSPIKSPPSSLFGAHLHTQSQTSFPITAVAVIGIIATAFLLVSYYIFVIKCCLNWHRIDLLRRFSASRTRREENPSMVYSPTEALENRGLDDAAIRSIPILKFEKEKTSGLVQNSKDQQKSFECAVCLNEFQEAEKLRVIPNCGHVFHIDCIDVWLQNNANCPLCRTSVSANSRGDFRNYLNRIPIRPSPPLQDLNPCRDECFSELIGDEDYVVIEIGTSSSSSSQIEHCGSLLNNPSISRNTENSSPDEFITISPSTRKSEPEILRKKVKHLSHVSSMGDECIDINRPKDEVQPVIRRSFSMDSAADSQLYRAVQEIIRQKHHKTANISEAVSSPNEGCCSSNSNGNKMKRSFFSFGQGRCSRSAVQPVALEPL